MAKGATLNRYLMIFTSANPGPPNFIEFKVYRGEKMSWNDVANVVIEREMQKYYKVISLIEQFQEETQNVVKMFKENAPDKSTPPEPTSFCRQYMPQREWNGIVYRF